MAGTRTFRGDEVAATPRPRRGRSAKTDARRRYAEAAAFVDDKTAMAAKVDAELAAAKKMRIDGVPHFIFKKPGKAPVEVTGAMPAPVLAQALA